MIRQEIPGREEFRLLRWTSSDEEAAIRKEFPLPPSRLDYRNKKRVRLKRRGGGGNAHRARSKSSNPCCLRQSPMYLCWFEDLHGLRLNLVLISFLLTVILLVIFAVHLHSQIINIQKAIVEERKFANDNHHRMHTTIQEIIANQSLLSNDITLLTNLYHNCSSHIHKLDSSLRTLMKTLDSAPELKTLPKDMEDAQKNLAKFGSALTNLESRVSGLETELTHNVAEMAQSLNKTLSKRNDEEFDSMVRVVVQERLQPLKEEIKQLDANRRIFASNITQQLKNQEVSFAQNLELMKQLEDEMRNSSRARPGKANFRGIIQSLRVEDENGGGGP
eukprot:TRINITY_DN5721_c0_g1_i1.p1 TRINITY_DN5721_c0_g1~~TRINITY_DN5721_c0_g1_i1.p1  ORF type:complete len:333 (-),score=63.12 TRINITY_DN5721_c0_g1_i1:248-1246(-)